MSARRRGSSTRAPCGGGRQEEAGLKRGPWTPEEDELLSRFVAREGEGRWRTLPRRAGLLRCGKSCRLRWMNYLRPSIKRGPIAADEEDLILRLHRLLGNRWSLIAGRLPGRTDNEIKNYWNTHLSKKLIAQGIDPRTHKPLADHSRDTCSKAKAPAPPLELVVVPAVLHPVSSVVDAGAGGDDHHLDGLGSFPWMMSLDGSDMWCGDVVGPQGLDDQLGGSSTKAAGGGRSDDGVGCSTVDDDGLSSFLDSLINDDCYILADNEVAADRSSGRDAALP